MPSSVPSSHPSSMLSAMPSSMPSSHPSSMLSPTDCIICDDVETRWTSAVNDYCATSNREEVMKVMSAAMAVPCHDHSAVLCCGPLH
eukprot:10350323-Ditylum_brightwellii.AAC.1